ncbi:MAG: acylphosphatase [Rhodospirillaceae bacterium]|nr:acylphosphatase [Rhodospirillaceae bacterium]
MSAPVTLHLLISGRVQGVGYRAWTQRTARTLTLTGWVRNHTDGRVEAVAQGPANVVDQFVAECHAGPPLARVTAVETTPAASEAFDGFQQRETASPESRN